MKNVYFKNRDTLIALSEGAVVENKLPENAIILLSPEYFYRKQFEMPADKKNIKDSVKRNLFSRFLPGSASDFKMLFFDLKNHGKRHRVLGLGISTEDLEELQKIFSEQKLVPLEAPFLSLKFEEPLLLEVPVMKGCYYFYYCPEFTWGRFVLSSPADARAETKSFLNQFCEQHGLESEYEDKRFAPDVFEEKWKKQILDILPLQKVADYTINSSFSVEFTGRLVKHTIFSATIIIIALLAWGWAEQKKAGLYTNLIETRAEQVLDQPPRHPVAELEARARQLRSNRVESEQLYPRYLLLKEIDKIIASFNIQLISIIVEAETGRLRFQIDSLSAGEQLVDELENSSLIEEVEMRQSDSYRQQEIIHELSVQLKWATGQ